MAKMRFSVTQALGDRRARPTDDPAPSSSAEATREPHQIGKILVESGRLSPENVARVLHLHQKAKIRFGEAALKLGVVNKNDIAFALAQQFAYPVLLRGDPTVSAEVVSAFASRSEAVNRFRILASQLVMRWFASADNHRILAIVSPDRGAGRSIVAANLAVVLAQLGHRTLLVDADMERPRQHDLFRIDNRIGLSSALARRVSTEAVKSIRGLSGLRVLPAGPTPPNPHDLLCRTSISELLADASRFFRIVIVDTPPWREGAGARTLASLAGAALMVVRANRTMAAPASDLAQDLTDARVSLLGVTLNEG